MPTKKTVIIGCIDPRVDPSDVFQLEPGEAVIVRNVGGRVDSAMLHCFEIVRTVMQANGKDVNPDWNLIVLHHTDCGIIPCLSHAPALLQSYFNVSEERLVEMEVADPYKAVVADIATLKANPDVVGDMTVSGLVYDVKTGLVETIVRPSRLRNSS